MKITRLFPILALVMGAFAFVACGDEEEIKPGTGGNQGTEQPTDSVVTNPTDSVITNPTDSVVPSDDIRSILGTYTGWTHVESTYINRDYAPDTLIVGLMEEEMQIGITMLKLTFIDSIWGTATIQGIHATSTDEGYVLEGGRGMFVTLNPRDNTTQEFPCQLAQATISADKTTVKAVISAYMEAGHGNMTFTFQTGEIPSAD